MNKIIHVLIFFLSHSLYSQKIEYIYKNDGSSLKYNLLINEKKQLSQWEIKENARGEQVEKDNINYFFLREGDTYYVNEKTIFKRKFITDNPKFIWKLEKEKKEILGYNCSSATTTFRGRKFKAYYTDELYKNFGPWKFNGLNGLILKIESEDGLYEFEAVNIDFNEKTNLLSEKKKLVENIKPINWIEFEKEYLNEIKLEIERQKCNCEKDGNNVLRISRIEKIHPEVHDNGIMF